MTEDEMVGQCHQSYQHEFDPTPGGSGRQEGLACSGPRSHEESDTTKRLNNNNNWFSGCTMAEICNKIQASECKAPLNYRLSQRLCNVEPYIQTYIEMDDWDYRNAML